MEALEKDGDTTSDQEKNRMKEMEREMMFATFMQTKFPKSTAAFAHRRWVIMTCCFSQPGKKESPNIKKRAKGYDDVIIIVIK